MNDERLKDSMVINVESVEANRIDLQEAVYMFSNLKRHCGILLYKLV